MKGKLSVPAIVELASLEVDPRGVVTESLCHAVVVARNTVLALRHLEGILKETGEGHNLYEAEGRHLKTRNDELLNSE